MKCLVNIYNGTIIREEELMGEKNVNYRKAKRHEIIAYEKGCRNINEINKYIDYRWNNLPYFIKRKMLDYQEEQKGYRDCNIFIMNTLDNMFGFEWKKTKEGFEVWSNILLYRDEKTIKEHNKIFKQKYDEKYKDKEELIRIGEIVITIKDIKINNNEEDRLIKKGTKVMIINTLKDMHGNYYYRILHNKKYYVIEKEQVKRIQHIKAIKKTSVNDKRKRIPIIIMKNKDVKRENVILIKISKINKIYLI